MGDGFVTITPVFNKPECHSCHNSAETVLGAIEVTLDTSLLAGHFREETVLIALLGLATFALVGGGLAVMLRGTVLNRLSALSRTAQRLSSGDYGARSGITTHDEIGVLASAFNQMAGSVETRDRELQASGEQLANLNSELEERVRRRTQDLSTMNIVLRTLSQSLDPDKMLAHVLKEMLTLMEIDAGVVPIQDDTTREMVKMTEITSSPEDVGDLAILRLDKTVRAVAQSGLPIISRQGMTGSSKFMSCVSLPIRSKQLTGVLTLASRSVAKFEPETVRLISAMCDALGIALENARVAKGIEEANKVREQLLNKLISAQEEERCMFRGKSAGVPEQTGHPTGANRPPLPGRLEDKVGSGAG